ncbi:oxidoreductase FAD/NAD(P)-binding protein [Hyphomicrobium denitrificans 1NES1]|uniref:Oxidoreductase FAD/NAD(P)-binding protein n=1 Tax=Hyphomicrobium denitrificans 1NES1 TaxID=670307 RepID=N0B1Z1_9HYPH|nr:FAD-dependent oxidoreductase [Hyphomicrobium denitrificans]AGK56958.1 oxidoreductase FAD/NAD(P)-binding protein [Hyphomicrobium denitrificans 1NES1]
MKSNVKLLKKETIARDTMAFSFEKPENFEFRAGQFADFTLINPAETDTEGDTRGFSLVHAPFEPNLVVATRMRNTAYKRCLKNLPVGAGVALDGPYGDFTLHKTQATPAAFLIGGIGVTPVRSMIAQSLHDRTAHEITLLHACRTFEDFPFKAEFEQLASKHRRITYVPVASESAPDDWHGERGRVDEAMVMKYVPDLNRPIYYLAGPEGMVKAMRELLIRLNVNEDNIRTEEFAGY